MSDDVNGVMNSWDDLGEVFSPLVEVEPSVSYPVNHGTWFDNGQRWCGLCSRTRLVLAASEHRPGRHLSCITCETLWPEAAEDFAIGVLSDEDIGMDFDIPAVMH